MRIIRWPAQERDRLWCRTRGIPRVLLVADGHPVPAAEPGELVLAADAAQPEVAAAVDLLAYGGGAGGGAHEAPSGPDASPGRSAHPSARPAAPVGRIAAVARLVATF